MKTTEQEPAVVESYWQQGCNDAKEHKPRRLFLNYQYEVGYNNGYDFGAQNRAKLKQKPPTP